MQLRSGACGRMPCFVASVAPVDYVGRVSASRHATSAWNRGRNVSMARGHRAIAAADGPFVIVGSGNAQDVGDRGGDGAGGGDGA